MKRARYCSHPLFAAFLLFLGSVPAATGAIRYVNKNAAGPVHDGASWATAFQTIQAGVDAAASGDEVWVAASQPAAPAYAERVTACKSIRLYGGFSGVETALSQRQYRQHETIIDGSGGNAITLGANVLDGFTVQNAVTGVFVAGYSQVVNCTIVNASDSGVKVAPDYNAQVVGCAITACRWAVVNDASDFPPTNPRYGSSVLKNCTLSENVGALFGGRFTVQNCIIAFNLNGISLGQANGAFTNNDVFGNLQGDYDSAGNPTGTNGNISADPKLSNRYHDLHIQPGSPCIDAGSDAAAAAGSTDIDGQPRIQGAHVDIGCDESDGTTWPSLSRTWFVSPSGSDANDGSSWSQAKKTVSAALASAQGSDEVWAAQGIYQEHVVMPAGLALYGGFAGTETERSQRNWTANPTILDGGGTGAVLTASVAGSVADGLTIRRGETGIEKWNGQLKVSHCWITNNSGAAVNGRAPLALENCTVSLNQSGLTLESGEVTNCTISRNGSGVVARDGYVTVSNCIVAFNGIGIKGSPTLTTLSHNNAFSNEGGDYVDVGSQGTQNGNISADPKLSNRYHDIHIQPGSPCIDAGSDAAAAAGSTDIDGQPRIQGAHVDIGCDESDGTTWPSLSRTWFVSPSGSDANDGSSWSQAKKTVSAALASAQGSDEVWLAKGTYSETVTLPAGVALYGGFAGTETERSQRNWTANPTILDGGGTGAVITAPYLATRLDGLTIRNGETGIAQLTGELSVANCRIDGNVDFGLLGQFGVSAIANCALTNNGSGIAGVSGTAANCTIVHNGSGVSYGNVAVANSIIAFNDEGFRYAAFDALSHNDVFGNAVADFAGALQPPTGTNGNISVDPRFGNRYRDLHIQPGSPCVDAGSDAAVADGSTDIDGQSRIQGAHVDIGADESDGTIWPNLSHTWFVSATGSDANDGSSWSQAKKTVSAALASAQGSDEVWLAKGTYSETVTLPAGVALYGGFAGTETERSQRNWTANPAILDGGGKGIVLTAISADIYVGGITVRNGETGVALGLSNRIEDCVITANSSHGVLIPTRCTASLRHCSLIANAQDAVYLSPIESISLASGLVVDSCTISGNVGNALYVGAMEAAVVRNSLFRDNGGAAVVLGSYGSIVLRNSTVAGNSNGLFLLNSYESVDAANCVIAYNTYGVAGNDTLDRAALRSNDVFGNAQSNFFNMANPTGTNGNISVDPLFVNRAAGDLRLSAGSPCIDAGDDASAAGLPFDLDGKLRPFGAHVDMGAYEFGTASFTLADAAAALRIAGGLDARAAGSSRLNADASSPAIDVLDALRIVQLASVAAGVR